MFCDVGVGSGGRCALRWGSYRGPGSVWPWSPPAPSGPSSRGSGGSGSLSCPGPMPLRWAPDELEAAAVTEAGTGRVPGETNSYGHAEINEGLFSLGSKGNRIQ